MKERNKLDRPLTEAEHNALESCVKALERGFGMKVYSMCVNPDRDDLERPFGVAFAFLYD